MVAGNVVLVFSLQAVLHGLVEVGLTLLVDHFSLKNTRAKYHFLVETKLTCTSSLGRYVFGSEISYNKAPPRLPGLGC